MAPKDKACFDTWYYRSISVGAAKEQKFGTQPYSTYQIASPEELDEESEWQRGPEFLRWPEAEWPVKTASEIVTTVADDVKKLKRKAFSAAVTRAQSKKISNPSKADVSLDLEDSSNEGQGPTSAAERPKRKPWGIDLVRLIEPKRFSTLSKLCGTVAWTRRAAESWLDKERQISDSAKWEVKYSRLSAEERAIAKTWLLQPRMAWNFTTQL